MLHIINRSPLSDIALESCLNTAVGGDVLLIEDAVYAATAGNAFEGKLRAAMGRFKISVLRPDLEARGMADRLIEGATFVDYAGFVELVAANKTCQSWL
ncbi:MAG: sulfurtransferase complex subunit TusB [Proteobacteria bacterium]|nr:sulfurtransferase complex subunit TusB [Pseudomonadota bacterium]